MFFDGYYIILIIPAILLSLYAQYKVQRTFKKYLSVGNSSNITGAQLAKNILNYKGLNNVQIEMVDGYLSDHYDPKNKVIRLSPEVYKGTSVSSLGVAAHETGHALQHNEGYIPLSIRSSLVPITNLGSWSAIPIIILGFLFQQAGLIGLGIIIFSGVVAFQLITLPVEFNASQKALKSLSNGFLTENELKNTQKVLNAAALTYVAAATTAIAELLRYILLFMSSKNE